MRTKILISLTWGLILLGVPASMPAQDAAPESVPITDPARAAGLFMLMFVVLISADTIAKPQRALPAALYVVNGFVVLFGLLGSFGMVSILRENRWLARYLAERQKGATDRLDARGLQ